MDASLETELKRLDAALDKLERAAEAEAAEARKRAKAAKRLDAAILRLESLIETAAE